MGLLTNISQAWRVLVSRRDVIAATVRPQETRGVRSRPSDLDDVQRALQYNRWVKILTDLTAQAVASRSVRIYRTRPEFNGRMGVWETRRVDRRERARLKSGPRSAVQKFADMHDNMEEIIDEGHPYVRLLDRVNRFQNGFDFIEQTDSLLSLYGNAYWVPVLGDSGYPVELWSLHPAFTTIVPDEIEFVAGYIYDRNTTGPLPFAESAVIHFHQKRGITLDPYYGVSNLDAVLLEADLSRLISVHQYSSLERGAQLGLILTGKGVTAENKEEIVTTINQKYAGAEAAGASMAIAGDITVSQWTQVEKELSYLGTGKDVRDMIAAAWNAPIALLTVENVNLAHGKVAAPMWQLISIGPRTRRMADKINERLSPLFNEALGERFVVCFEEPDLEDSGAKSAAILSQWERNLIPRMEARADLGKDDIDDGKPVWFSDTQPQPVAADPFGAFGGGLAMALNADTAKFSRGMARAEARAQQFADKVNKDADAPRTDWIWTDDPHREDWNKRVQNADEIVATERQLTNALRRWFGGLEGRVSENGSYRVVLESETLPDNIEKLLDKLFLQGMQAASIEAKIDPPGELTEGAVQYLRERERTLVETLRESVNERLSRTLQESIEAGETIRETTMRVSEVIGPEATANAAERIARTETSNAYLEGRLEQFNASPSVEGVEWLLSSNPCPVCLGIHARSKTVKKGTPFVKAGETFPGTITQNKMGDIYRPPAHPNCRCSAGAVLTEELEALR